MNNNINLGPGNKLGPIDPSEPLLPGEVITEKPVPPPYGALHKTNTAEGITISVELMKRLIALGIVHSNGVRDYNVGDSNYAKHTIQPWAIWQDWNLNPWDGDIIKRTLRDKTGDVRKLDYEKIIHICQERIRQLDAGLD